MRKAISDNIIHNALDLREGSAFERGRLIGQLEKEIAWQAYDAARKTREALTNARKRLRRDKVEDWCDLSEDELLRKLIERKVVTLQEGCKDSIDVDGIPKQTFQCSDEFLEICKCCHNSRKVAQATNENVQSK